MHGTWWGQDGRTTLGERNSEGQGRIWYTFRKIENMVRQTLWSLIHFTLSIWLLFITAYVPECILFDLQKRSIYPSYLSPELHFRFTRSSREACESWLFTSLHYIPLPSLSPPLQSTKDLRWIFASLSLPNLRELVIKEEEGTGSLTFSIVFGWPLGEKTGLLFSSPRLFILKSQGEIFSRT